MLAAVIRFAKASCHKLGSQVCGRARETLPYCAAPALFPVSGQRPGALIVGAGIPALMSVSGFRAGLIGSGLGVVIVLLARLKWGSCAQA